MTGFGIGRRWMLMAGLCVVVLGSLAVIASRTLDAAAVVERIQEWLDGTRDMEARFEQTMTSGALGTGVEESGRMYLQRPGRMRWDYLEPEKKVALIHGDSTRLYLEEDQQLWEGRLESGSLLTMLLADAQPIATLFDAELLDTPGRGEAKRIGAGQIGFGILQFLAAHALVGHAPPFLAHYIDGLAGPFVGGAGAAENQTGRVHG